MAKLEEIEDIGPAYASKLREAGVISIEVTVGSRQHPRGAAFPRT